jgi:dTDP-4-dehydrorhamnose 3,5-epimerase
LNLSDVYVNSLLRIETDGGDVLHALKQSDNGYAGYGEAYFSWVDEGSVKGWKRHKQMIMNLIVPVGHVRFVFRGLNNQGIPAFQVEEIGESRYVRITVPPKIWFAFQGLGKNKSLVLNIANISHDPNEIDRLPLTEIDYVWN